MHSLSTITEAAVKPRIKAAFRAAGCVVIPTPVLRRSRGIQGAPPGWPDLMVLVPPGAVLMVELKRPRGGTYGPEQERVHAWLRRHGYEVVTVTTPEEAVLAVEKVRRDA